MRVRCVSRLAATVCLAFVLLHDAAASEPKKIALLIGNGQYTSVQKLNNAENDVRLIAASLREIGFVATEAFNLTLPQMVSRVDEFVNAIGPGDIGLFYYAGHAVQLGGKNYLVPVSAKIASETDLPFKTFNTDQLIAKVGKDLDSVKVVVLDACRNNPYALKTRSLKQPSRLGTNGLARIEAPAGSRGMYIAYSTAPGQVAYDGQGKNSPYAAALAKEIKRPGLNITEVFQNVRNGVMQATAGQGTEPQIPWESSSLTANLVLVPTGLQAEVRKAYAPAVRTSHPELELTPLTRGGRPAQEGQPAPRAQAAPPSRRAPSAAPIATMN